ncbi:MAG: hypothetical protein ACJAWH_000007 [Maribacter sp.]|jgi:hypothetical protein
MKRYFFLIILVVGVLAACTDRDDDVTMVNIRIQNSTETFFSEVRVVGKDTVYGTIAAGEYSKYLEYAVAFQEMALTVVADSTTLNYSPELVFTDSLPIGFYTYELTLDQANRLDLNFKIN